MTAMRAFTYSADHDINDGREWTASDDADLISAAACGSTLRQAAELLCRSGSLWDVAERAKMLGLTWRKVSTRKPYSR